MRIGDLRHRITLQRNVTARNEVGEDVPDWQEIATVWAAIQPLQGQERFAAQQVQANLSHKVTIRYSNGWYTEWVFVTQHQVIPSGDPVKVTPELRVMYGDRVLEILAVIDLKERHQFMELYCSEVV